MTITTKRNAKGAVNCYVNGKKTAVAEIAEIAIAGRDTRENGTLTVINENGEAYDINTWEKWFVCGTRAAKKIAELIRIVGISGNGAPATNAENSADPADYVISEEAMEVATNAEIEMANVNTPTDKLVLEETDEPEILNADLFVNIYRNPMQERYGSVTRTINGEQLHFFHHRLTFIDAPALNLEVYFDKGRMSFWHGKNRIARDKVWQVPIIKAAITFPKTCSIGWQ